MGKSACGKDTVYRKIREDYPELAPIVLYTTRPMRAGEQDGVTYHFIDRDKLNEFDAAGKVIERRAYNTVKGLWEYACIDDGQVQTGPDAPDHIAIGTLEAYAGMKDYYGEDMIEPIYLYASDETRINRAVGREKEQETPNYMEICRRFLADDGDFSAEKLAEAGIDKGYEIEVFDDCYAKIREMIEATHTDNAR